MAQNLDTPQTSPSAPRPRGSHRARTPWVPTIAAAALTAVVVSLACIGLTGGFDATEPPDTAAPVSDSSMTRPDWEKVAAGVRDTVVAIQVTTGDTGAEGSGVVIDAEEGHVVTNNHVATAGTDIEILLTDGTVHTAAVVGTDPTTDIAVLKFDKLPGGLRAAGYADSSSVVVGQPVMAVGNPLGLADTATSGIVSALNRPVTTVSDTSDAEAVVTNAIQTDAPVNPGNSGGPLFDGRGRVIGINSSIASMPSLAQSQQGSIGLGFAIPSDTVRMIADQLVQNGRAQHAYLGVTLEDGSAQADGEVHAGATITEVTGGGPAAGAGIEAGDVVVGVDGSVVTSAISLIAFVRSFPVGRTVTLSVVRDGKSQDVTVKLGAMPASMEPTEQPTPRPTSALSQEMRDQLKKYLEELQGGGSGS